MQMSNLANLTQCDACRRWLENDLIESVDDGGTLKQYCCACMEQADEPTTPDVI